MSNTEYSQDNAVIEELLSSVERPGNYCALGRLFAAMPVVSVDGVSATEAEAAMERLRKAYATS
ncbi:MAG: hypothetical protein OXP11_13375 [Gammaproteobacteria bacterium]|nr:hypothetical protein [Gammaproteobacteria bacterium]